VGMVVRKTASQSLKNYRHSRVGAQAAGREQPSLLKSMVSQAAAGRYWPRGCSRRWS